MPLKCLNILQKCSLVHFRSPCPSTGTLSNAMCLVQNASAKTTTLEQTERLVKESQCVQQKLPGVVSWVQVRVAD